MKTPKLPKLIEATFRGDPEEVRALLGQGADTEARDRDERTALHHASVDGQAAIAQLLIASGANVGAADKAGHTPLHFAVQDFHLDVATLLLEAGAPVDAQDRDGNSPLSGAVFESRGRGEMIRLLLRFAADPDKPNAHGVSPRQLANTIANFPVAQFFAEGN
jgi:ankyrin repeat protein